jgi:hypothetical protein
MNMFAKITSIALVSSTAFTGAAFAAGATDGVAPQPYEIAQAAVDTEMGTMMPDADVSAWNGKDVSIVRIDSKDKNDPSRIALEALTDTEIASTQAALSANPMLVEYLKTQSVELNNVVKLMSFPNGSVKIYLR